jgi:hypothetical protein
MDSTLSWKEQVTNVSQKVYGSLNQLYQFRRNTLIETRIRLVISLVLPIFDYCDVVYCDANKEMEVRLSKMLNACVRYVYNLRKFDHVSEFYNKLKWLRIEERREFNLLC